MKIRAPGYAATSHNYLCDLVFFGYPSSLLGTYKHVSWVLETFPFNQFPYVKYRENIAPQEEQA